MRRALALAAMLATTPACEPPGEAPEGLGAQTSEATAADAGADAAADDDCPPCFYTHSSCIVCTREQAACEARLTAAWEAADCLAQCRNQPRPPRPDLSTCYR